MKSSSLEGRTYLVTGSASGIGAATAALLTDLGANVIGCDLAGAEIEADLATVDGRNALVAQASARGPIDAVLAVAGGVARSVVETNYFGAVATLEGLRPLLLQSPAPRAVVISSTASVRAFDERLVEACLAGDEAAAVRYAADLPEGVDAYCCVKRALNRWIRRAAPTAEWAGAGIALNAVAPGVVDTPAAQFIFESEEVRAVMEAACPQPYGGFPGRPEWIADLACWLAGPENHFVTGQIVFADGGAEAINVGEKHWLS